MGFMERLRNLDRKFAWSFTGVVLAVLLGGLTLYDRFIADRRPKPVFDIVDNALVVDLPANLPKLTILYAGTNIREQHLALRLMTVRIVNDSNRDILQTHFDANDPVGIQLSAGRIVTATLSDYTNNYIGRNVSATRDATTIYIRPIILEAQQGFAIKLLVLHPETQMPVITPIGHIAGVTQLVLRNSYNGRSEAGFFSGSIPRVLLRTAVLLFIFGPWLVCLWVIMKAIEKWQYRRERRFLSDRYIDVPDDGTAALLRKLFVAGDWVSLNALQELCDVPNRVLTTYHPGVQRLRDLSLLEHMPDGGVVIRASVRERFLVFGQFMASRYPYPGEGLWLSPDDLHQGAASNEPADRRPEDDTRKGNGR